MFGSKTQQDSPGTGGGRDKWWYAAAVFAGFAALALVLVLTVGPGNSDSPGQPAAASPSPSSPARQADPGRPPGCHTTATDQTVPTQAPTGIQWHLVHGTAVPSSPTAGPMRRDGAASYCYAHTPTGALLAAWDIPQGLHGATHQARQMNQIAKHSLVANQYARQLQQLANKPNQSGRSTSSGSAGSSSGQIAAFRFLSYSPQVATIALVAQFSERQGAYQAETVTLRWKQGDWRYQIHQGPRLAATVQVVQDLSNYIPFSGVH